MSIIPELLAAYTATDYWIDVDPPVVARPDEHTAEVDALLTATQVRMAAVITAWNPHSELFSEAQNAEAQQDLVEAVEAKGLSWLPAEGRGRDGAWPPEPSLCILGIRRDEAEALSRHFRQKAFLWLEAGHPARVVVTASDRDPEDCTGHSVLFSGRRA